MNQKITFATVLVAFSVFFICFTNATPVEFSPRKPGAVAFADFTKKVTGRITITELWNTCVRITGQFNTGFPDRTHKYEYQLSGEEKGLISNDIIFPPGTAPFEKDIQGRTVEYFVGKTLSIFCNGVVIEEVQKKFLYKKLNSNCALRKLEREIWIQEPIYGSAKGASIGHSQ
ncbi:hypothetical protein Glove_60g63 [Diversispora epigaea]|uniref:Uncharacterized protein n=1 Tax=Diversispora epigaea TaxID=1348612 RepID=A0A397JLJ1_9GLOM|nr:hypothetical protein Glove_60g63 [Diversispora epigaea]